MTQLLPPSHRLLDPDDSERVSDRPHRLEGNAFRGIKRGIRGSSRFSALIFFGALVVVAAAVLHCEWTEWCLLCAAIGIVLITELNHSAIQSVVRLAETENNSQCRAAEDLAAASGFVATIVAIIIGAAVFLHRFYTVVSSQ